MNNHLLAQDTDKGKGSFITIQCAYCGNEDTKLPINLTIDEMRTTTIKCKCGKWLIRSGIMGHKHNDY